jgi:hypothetical protein
MPKHDIQQRRTIPNYFQASRSGIMFQPEPVFFDLEKFLVQVQAFPKAPAPF